MKKGKFGTRGLLAVAAACAMVGIYRHLSGDYYSWVFLGAAGVIAFGTGLYLTVSAELLKFKEYAVAGSVILMVLSAGATIAWLMHRPILTKAIMFVFVFAVTAWLAVEHKRAMLLLDIEEGEL